MNNPLLEFFQYGPDLRSFIEYDFPEEDFDEDWSAFNVIDGEEGDYGIVPVSKNGVLLFTYINYGGDSEDYKFTPEGKAYFTNKLKEAIDIWFSKL